MNPFCRLLKLIIYKKSINILNFIFSMITLMEICDELLVKHMALAAKTGRDVLID